LVFNDPFHISIQDRHENGEERWQTLGLINGLAVILVAHSVYEDNDLEIIRISPHEKQRNRKGCVMNKLTKKQTAELNHLATLSDDAIDTSDILEQPHWQNATVGRFYSATHQSNVKLDNDILAWFKANCSGDYQKMINQALRDYMQQSNKPTS
jgi:uncharacterized protein (DUF4415 family)